MNTKELDSEYIIGTYKRQDVVLTRGRGAVALDETGKKYIDFGSGIGVNSLGYCDERWADAVAEQAHRLQHASNLYYTQPAVRLAKLLCEQTGYRKALFCNSGAEANECAIKIARKYCFDKYGAKAKRDKILTLQNSFHGRTVTTLSATGQDVFHNYFFPFTDGFSYAPANDIDAVKAALSQGGYCAVMFEFIQGEGGVVSLSKDFVKELFDYCQAHDILTVADEVQTGIGRTGTLLASGQFGVQPDITTLAKGLGGGLPIGAVITNEKTMDVLSFGDHGTTFGANPVVCAGAYEALSRIADPAFLANVRGKGEKIRAALSGCREAESVTGLGMMLGIELKTKKAADVLSSCIDKGLLLLTAKAKIRLLPPLTIDDVTLEKGLQILLSVLDE